MLIEVAFVCDRAVAASVVMAAYGHKVTSNDDPYIHLVEKASRMTAASGSPGATPVDFVPARKSIVFLVISDVAENALYSATYTFLDAWSGI